MRHGLPDEEREWSLNGTGVKTSGHKKVPIRQCMKCYAVVPLSAKDCKWCGTVFPVKPREVTEEEGELAELTPEQMEADRHKRLLRHEQSSASSYEALLRIEKMRSYKPGWARHVWEAKQQKRLIGHTGVSHRAINGTHLNDSADWYRPKR